MFVFANNVYLFNQCWITQLDSHKIVCFLPHSGVPIRFHFSIFYPIFFFLFLFFLLTTHILQSTLYTYIKFIFVFFIFLLQKSIGISLSGETVTVHIQHTHSCILILRCINERQNWCYDASRGRICWICSQNEKKSVKKIQIKLNITELTWLDLRVH